MGRSMWQNTSAEDFDSLSQLHGVLCAFLLSIAIGVQYSVSAENFQYATFL